MRYRQFGKTGWRVSEIGFGGARIGGLLAEDGGRATSLRTLEAACDAGINFYDTADMYSQGESEILIGKAFRKKRDKVFIATKGGYCLPGQKQGSFSSSSRSRSPLFGRSACAVAQCQRLCRVRFHRISRPAI